MTKRSQQLLAREQDGELSAVEKDELERLSRLDPDARRSRAAWERFGGALKNEPGSKLFTAALARRVLDGVDARPAAMPRRVYWALAAAAAACVLFYASAHTEVVAPVVVRAPVDVRAPTFAARRPLAAPVVVDLTDSDAEDPAVVQIRF